MVILCGALEAISQALFWLVALLVPAMALIVTYEVVVRYAFGRPTIWVTEIASYMLVAVAFLGASWTLKCGGHQGDIRYRNVCCRHTRLRGFSMDGLEHGDRQLQLRMERFDTAVDTPLDPANAHPGWIGYAVGAESDRPCGCGFGARQ